MGDRPSKPGSVVGPPVTQNPPVPVAVGTPSSGDASVDALVSGYASSQLAGVQASGQEDPGVRALKALLDPTQLVEQDPAWRGQRMSSVLYEPFDWSESQLLQFQRNLVAAGYISENQSERMIPGYYDEYTRAAFAQLFTESIHQGKDPRDVMVVRIARRSGKDPKQVLGRDELDADEHRRQMADVYVRSHGSPAPPGYLDKFPDFNAEEFELFERSKASWQSSQVAKDQTAAMEAQLGDWLQGGSLRGIQGAVQAGDWSSAAQAVSQLTTFTSPEQFQRAVTQAQPASGKPAPAPPPVVGEAE